MPLAVAGVFLVGGIVSLGYTLVLLFRFAVLMHTGDGFADPERKREGLRLFKRLALASTTLIVVWNVGAAIVRSGDF